MTQFNTNDLVSYTGKAFQTVNAVVVSSTGNRYQGFTLIKLATGQPFQIENSKLRFRRTI